MVNVNTVYRAKKIFAITLYSLDIVSMAVTRNIPLPLNNIVSPLIRYMQMPLVRHCFVPGLLVTVPIA